MNCIQIDAAINPGNSGGALFNMWGQVIGITSSKLASSDYEGIGFAVSIDEAKPVIEELMEKGYVAGRTAPILTNGIIDADYYINPIPAGLVLTGIVVSVSVTAFSLALVLRLYKHYGSLDMDEILRMMREEEGE